MGEVLGARFKRVMRWCPCNMPALRCEPAADVAWSSRLLLCCRCVQEETASHAGTWYREACNKAEKDLLRGGQRPRKECRRNFELHAPQGVTPSLIRLCNWGNAVCNLLFILHYLIMCESMDFAKTAGCCWTMPACAKLAASARIP